VHYSKISNIPKDKIQEEVDRLFRTRIKEVCGEDREFLKIIKDHMKRVAEIVELLVKEDKERNYEEYKGLNLEIAWIAARLHDLADLDTGKKGYDRWNRKEHGMRSKKYAFQVLKRIGYSEENPEKMETILKIIELHDLLNPREAFSKEAKIVTEADILWRMEPVNFSVIFMLLKKRKIVENKKEVLERLKRMTESLSSKVSKEIASEWLEKIEKTI